MRAQQHHLTRALPQQPAQPYQSGSRLSKQDHHSVLHLELLATPCWQLLLGRVKSFALKLHTCRRIAGRRQHARLSATAASGRSMLLHILRCLLRV